MYKVCGKLNNKHNIGMGSDSLAQSITVKQGSTVVQGRSVVKRSWSDNFGTLLEKRKVNFPLLGM